MNRTIQFILAAVSLALAGCATGPTAPPVVMTTTFAKDPYQTFGAWTSPWDPNSPGNKTFLKAIEEGGKITKIYAYLIHKSNQWAFFEYASDKNGTNFDVTKVDSQVAGGWTIETVLIPVTIDYLEKAQPTGLDIKFHGKRGEMVITMTPDYIQEFLSKVKPKS